MNLSNEKRYMNAVERGSHVQGMILVVYTVTMFGEEEIEETEFRRRLIVLYGVMRHVSKRFLDTYLRYLSNKMDDMLWTETESNLMIVNRILILESGMKEVSPTHRILISKVHMDDKLCYLRDSPLPVVREFFSGGWDSDDISTNRYCMDMWCKLQNLFHYDHMFDWGEY